MTRWPRLFFFVSMLFFSLRLIKFFKVNMPQFITDLQEVLYYQLAVRKARSSNRRRTNVGVSRLSEDDDKMVTTLFNMIDRYERRMFVCMCLSMCAHLSPRPPPVSRLPSSSLSLTTPYHIPRCFFIHISSRICMHSDGSGELDQNELMFLFESTGEEKTPSSGDGGSTNTGGGTATADAHASSNVSGETNRNPGETFRHLFKVFDLDGNGSISPQEFKCIVKYLKLNSPDLLARMHRLASNKFG